jgi:hypothetical protein
MGLTRRDVLKVAMATTSLSSVGSRLSWTNEPQQGSAANVPAPEPRIARFEQMAYGLFIHWGLFSHLGRCVWGVHPRRYPAAEYQKLPAAFFAKDFNAREIASIARRAGMKQDKPRHTDFFIRSIPFIPSTSARRAEGSSNASGSVPHFSGQFCIIDRS